MQKNKVFKLIFSSSATVYGSPSYLPIDEKHPINPINPYGSTKVDAEALLKKFAQKNLSWKILSLRYFNPIGADDSYLLGDNPSGNSDNLFPFLLNVASGEENYLKVFGNDYDTHDGTGVRDYIHILDLVDGHIAALLHLEEIESANYDVINLGSGNGFSVLDIINHFEKITKVSIPYKYYPARDGDVASSFADNIKAFKSLRWTNRRTLNDMCKSAWEFKKLSKS
jgi:UDP-glucose 4-epimerase